MYSGIIQGVCPVVALDRKPGLLSFTVDLPSALLEGLEPGDSVAVDGVCQTVASIQDAKVWFDAMQETLGRTTLDRLAEGSRVNIERSLKVGDENGGHEIAGHVDGRLQVVNVEASDNNLVLTFEIPAAYRPYVFDKGFLAIHGASLTVSNLDRHSGHFQVFLIPETLRRTNLGALQAGDEVNFEIDRRTQVIVDTTRACLEQMWQDKLLNN